MRTFCKLLGLLSLVFILIMPFVYAYGFVSFTLLKQVLFVATLIWFGSAIFWIGKDQPEQSKQPESESIL